MIDCSSTAAAAFAEAVPESVLPTICLRCWRVWASEHRDSSLLVSGMLSGMWAGAAPVSPKAPHDSRVTCWILAEQAFQVTHFPRWCKHCVVACIWQGKSGDTGDGEPHNQMMVRIHRSACPGGIAVKSWTSVSYILSSGFMTKGFGVSRCLVATLAISPSRPSSFLQGRSDVVCNCFVAPTEPKESS